ncbi:MAG TPA: phage holin family protein [Microbacterium sp.]|uniref:phage holin family protein n=1 Tax=Microbacterium sp. TaxID=51671 RepID=UPI002C2FB613|nr:phage holin family protein [Microbacterium sp.]HWI30888.1 phage holin family protein [Microbacterium sp.]
MTTPRGFRDRADDSLFTLLGDVPELVRNLVVAEVNSAKAWVSKAAKDVGIGAGWFVAALFFLFWAVAAFGAFVIIGLSSWWPAWLSALVVFVLLVVIALVLALLGYLRFRKLAGASNPVESVQEDVRMVKEVGDEF